MFSAMGDPLIDGTPFGRFIRACREQKRLTVRAAAKAAGVSEARWRQLEAGFQTVGGVRVPALPKPRTARLMADAVYADPEAALMEAGHPHNLGGATNPDTIISRRLEAERQKTVSAWDEDASYVADRGPEPLPPTDLDEQALAERIRLGLEAMDEMRRRNGG